MTSEAYGPVCAVSQLFSRLVPRFLVDDFSKPITRIFAVLLSTSALLVLAGCGGSGGQSVQPPILSYPTPTAVYTEGVAIAANTPANSGGAATSYTVTPALPVGLSLNSSTGVISGTPTAVAAQAVYTVTASNSGGSSSFRLTITVNDIAPSGLSYSVNPAVYSDFTVISPNVPSWSGTGGTPTSFAATQSLPSGLSLDPTTGILSGTPTQQTPQGNYTIVASNSGGSTSASLTITVLPQAPFITVQPASQYVGSGIATYFAVGFGGEGILSFQWYKNGAPISGSNSNVYATPVLSNADNGERFNVIISDNYNRSVTSNVATLTIKGVSGTFVTTGTPNDARECESATLLQNGKVLIAGGRNGNTALASAELYDPATGTFTATGSLSTERCAHSATLLPNGKVLIAGGYSFANNGGLPTLASAELYDPASGTFSSTGSLGTGRAGHSATLLTNGKVLVAAGASSNDGFQYQSLASAELYDPLAGTFSATGSLNTPRSAPATLLSNGNVLIAGGSSIGAGILASAEIYDPGAGTFTLTGSLNTARAASATLLQNGKVLIAGGIDHTGNVLSSAEIYDPSSGTFTATGSLNAARASSATLLSNGQVLFVGGEVSAVAQQVLKMSELYDPASGVFILNAPTNSDRFFMSATFLKNGQVLIEGQETPAGGANPVPAEIYKP